MNETLQSIDILAKVIENQFIPKLIISATIILIVSLVRWLVLRTANKYVNEVRVRYIWRKWTTHLSFLLSSILVISVWFKEFSSVLTFLGLLSAGIAIALREPVVNFFGWIFLFWRKPFNIGDRIKIGEDTGDVIDIRIFQFSMMEVGVWVNSDQYTGRIIEIPNGKVFTFTQYNFTKMFPIIWNELSFRVTFESDIERTKELITKSFELQELTIKDEDIAKIKEVIENHIVYNATTEPSIFYKVTENGIQFTLRYICKFNERRATEQLLWQFLIKAIQSDAKVNFAYPTHRLVAGSSNSNDSTSPYNIV